MKKITITLAASMLLLTACGGGDDASTPTATTPATTPTSTIMVTNMSGGTTDITGTWLSGCFPGSSATVPPTNDLSYTDILSGTTYTYNEIQYTTTDGSCGGAGSTIGTASGTFVKNPDVTANLGWMDVSGAATVAPINQSGTASLPATPIATQLLVSSYTSATGSLAFKLNNGGKFIGAVDATSTGNPVFYMVFGSTGSFEVEAMKSTKQ